MRDPNERRIREDGVKIGINESSVQGPATTTSRDEKTAAFYGDGPGQDAPSSPMVGSSDQDKIIVRDKETLIFLLAPCHQRQQEFSELRRSVASNFSIGVSVQKMQVHHAS